jgi:ferritin-like metal-binding protein YciE
MPTKSKAASKQLNDLFLDTLKDIYYAEKQILRALPKMAKAADSDALRKAFEDHRVQTQGQVERLDEVFEIIAKRAQGKTCEAILGIIEEGKGIIEEFDGSPALDAGLISAAQAVEHYEISRYGTLKTWAQTLGMQDVAKLLDASLEEERATDELLTKVAETAVNAEAMAEAA